MQLFHRVVVTAAVIISGWCAVAHAEERDYEFRDRISREVLDCYLSRAVTMLGMLHQSEADVNEDLRMLTNIGGKFIGRAIYRWGSEHELERLLARAKPLARKAHSADPDLILQASVFEIVTVHLNDVSIPAWVFEQFDIEPELRNFRYRDMIYPKGHWVNHWSPGASVPDMSRLETRMWFLYASACYIDIGCEAIHFGQVEIMDDRDPDRAHWRDMLTHVRAYAKKHARRGFVLCDAHVPSGGIVHQGHLLFDFHSFPLRVDEVVAEPHQGVLKTGYLDSIYGRSKGGITPSGWACKSLPYIVEFDNFGRSGHEGENYGQHWIWGWDEINWFANQPEEYRNQWLRYAWDWVRKHDSNGWLQMPGRRGRYRANTPSSTAPDGFGQEKTIKALWDADDAAH